MNTQGRSRLVEADTDFGRELLASWHAEQPSGEARERTLAALGLSGGAAIGVGASTATSVSKAAAPKAVAAGTAWAAKWVGIGLVVVSAGAVGGYGLRRGGTSPPTVDAASAAPNRSATTPGPLAASPRVVQSAAPRAAEEPSVAPAPRAASRTTSTPLPGSTPWTEPSPQLLDEVASLDRAQAALAAGHPALALELVAEHERRFPRGALAQEAAVVHVRALWDAGQRDAARALAARFLTAHPSSPHAARMRALTTQ
jgi:hypothetical protein